MNRLVIITLCGTLWVATVGIVGLMFMKINVALPATGAVALGWRELLKVADKKGIL